MTQQDKDLLLRDLSARLPYGVKIYYGNKTHSLSIPYLEDIKNIALGHEYSRGYNIKNISIKPYLRPMSSMTEEENNERKQLGILCAIKRNGSHERIFDGFGNEGVDTQLIALDWLNKHHFDYRGLIEKGLAIEAPDNMYKIV